MPSRRFALFRANRLERSSEVSKTSEMEIEEFARIGAKLIRNSAEVRQAVWDCACQCPVKTSGKFYLYFDRPQERPHALVNGPAWVAASLTLRRRLDS